MRRILGIATLVLATLMPAHANAANTWGTDFSDLWWNRDESGWGVNFAHQGDTIFMTLFVYGEDDRVRWYVGPALTYRNGLEGIEFYGTLYETTGPYLGRAFNPEEVVDRVAGDATIFFPTGKLARLHYTVDYVTQTKWIRRQTFRANDLTGSYIGATIGSTANCGAGAGAFEHASQFSVNHAGSAIVIQRSDSGAASCTYSGGYEQSGRMGFMTGTVSCTNGLQGTFEAFEGEAGYQSFSTRYTADYGNGCTESGRFGGMKRE